MNYTTRLLLGTLIFACFFSQAYPMIKHVKNNSEHPITIAFMVSGKIQMWNPEWEDFGDISAPLEIAPGWSLKINAPIPQARLPFEERPSFEQLNQAIPIYLQVKTKRKVIKDQKKSNASPRYQNATFNIVYGSLQDPNMSRKAVWAQKSVDAIITCITIMGELGDSVLIIDKNGTPSLSAITKKKTAGNNSNWNN